MGTSEQKRLISHAVSPEAIKDTLKTISNRIQKEGGKSTFSVERQLDILHQLTQFDFGRYLLQNKGINGFWTHYMLTHPWFGRKTGKNNKGESLLEMERFLLDRAPTFLATQQRFEIFLRENQKSVRNNVRLACIPSGMLGELLYLNFDNIKKIELFGIDYDPEAKKDAGVLAENKNLAHWVHFEQQDAWQLTFNDDFDLISSNGLNIYEPNDDKVTSLYQEFYRALKEGGRLVTSFLTFPPTMTDDCEWDFTKIDENNLLLQQIIFKDIIQASWQCFRSTVQTKQQLESVGFRHVNFIYDRARIFPTVTAEK